ncbi:MAG: class I SAM-dependent methyltransferase [Acidimicrobiia bacterium]
MPELYERARPSYPSKIFDDLVVLAQLPVGSRIVEIGCGTGKATVPLAQRGYAITCVELGQQLAALTRRKVAGFPSVEVITSNFETWQAEHSDFDAVVAFSSFHWIASDIRYNKAAGLLRERGKLAVVSMAHVLPHDGDPFFIEVQKDYEAVVPDDQNTNTGAAGPPEPDEVADLSDEVLCGEIEASGRFCNVGARRYLWDVIYTADEYIAVLNTFSAHRALDDDTRARLDTRIHRRILARPERKVRTTYLAMLYVAERV